MNEFNSVEEFLEEAELSEKQSSGAERKGKFIAIYDSEGAGNSPQGTISSELVEGHELHDFDFISFTEDFGDEVHAFLFTEEFLNSRDDLNEENSFALSPSGGPNNLDFSGVGILEHLNLEPPVRFRLNEGESSNGEAIRTGGCVLLSLYKAEF